MVGLGLELAGPDYFLSSVQLRYAEHDGGGLGSAAWRSARLPGRWSGWRILPEFEWLWPRGRWIRRASKGGRSDCACAGVWREPGGAELRARVSGPGVSGAGLSGPGLFPAISVGLQSRAADWKPTATGLWRGGLVRPGGCWVRWLDAGISRAGGELWTRQLLLARLKLVHEQEQHEKLEGAELLRRLPFLWWRARFWRRARSEGAE